MLSSFFSGYALTQVLGGQLADKYGGKVRNYATAHTSTLWTTGCRAAVHNTRAAAWVAHCCCIALLLQLLQCLVWPPATRSLQQRQVVDVLSTLVQIPMQAWKGVEN